MRALAAFAVARAPVDLDDALLANLTDAVRRMDEADRAYRAAIEAQLPAAKATPLLQAMALFRSNVAQLREQTRITTEYGDFDPLDTYVPSIPASHAHAVRAANTADLARGEVARLRRKRSGILRRVVHRRGKCQIHRKVAQSQRLPSVILLDVGHGERSNLLSGVQRMGVNEVGGAF